MVLAYEAKGIKGMDDANNLMFSQSLDTATQESPILLVLCFDFRNCAAQPAIVNSIIWLNYWPRSYVQL